jgi:hypothetical protein
MLNNPFNCQTDLLPIYGHHSQILHRLRNYQANEREQLEHLLDKPGSQQSSGASTANVHVQGG